ncbi:hypothetical protein D3C81_2272760 [compost metagenome]
MTHGLVPGRTEVVVLVQQDLNAKVQLAVPAGVLHVANLSHRSDALVQAEPQGVLVERAVLPGS